MGREKSAEKERGARRAVPLRSALKEGRGKPRPYRRHRQECLCYWLVDVVLLPMKGSVGLDDDVFVRGLLQLVH
jgi:hypothetical protein